MHVVSFIKNYWLLSYILLLGLALGLYQLDTLPNEMWGDATAHYYLAQQVLSGHFFFNYRYGGDGPIYTYLVVLVATVFGLSFYTLKLTAVFISIGFIAVMYFLSYELFKQKRIAYITSFLSAVSFWSLIFARQPHARILVPLFIALTILLALKKKTVWSGILLGLGMYTQASIWALPFVFFKRHKILLIGLLITIPLVILFFTSPIGFLTDKSYFGEKLATTDHLSLLQILKNIASNLLANILSFNFIGDKTFRVNVPRSPHLDVISGIFFVVGLGLLMYKTWKEKNTRLLQFLILPLFIIQIPSLLDIHNPGAQPNIGRLIGVIPFVFVMIAYAIETVTTTLFSLLHMKANRRKLLENLFLVILLFLIATINFSKYFFMYPLSLPNHNVPFAKIIASSIDALPQRTNVLLLGVGWGQWQQPELGAIIYSIKKQHTIYYLPELTNSKIICRQIQNAKNNKTVIITNPTNTTLQTSIAQCANIESSGILRNNPLYDVARILEVSAK
jgi:hypothetical protein